MDKEATIMKIELGPSPFSEDTSTKTYPKFDTDINMKTHPSLTCRLLKVSPTEGVAATPNFIKTYTIDYDPEEDRLTLITDIDKHTMLGTIYANLITAIEGNVISAVQHLIKFVYDGKIHFGLGTLSMFVSEIVRARLEYLKDENVDHDEGAVFNVLEQVAFVSGAVCLSMEFYHIQTKFYEDQLPMLKFLIEYENNRFSIKQEDTYVLPNSLILKPNICDIAVKCTPAATCQEIVDGLYHSLEDAQKSIYGAFLDTFGRFAFKSVSGNISVENYFVNAVCSLFVHDHLHEREPIDDGIVFTFNIDSAGDASVHAHMKRGDNKWRCRIVYIKDHFDVIDHYDKIDYSSTPIDLTPFIRHQLYETSVKEIVSSQFTEVVRYLCSKINKNNIDSVRIIEPMDLIAHVMSAVIMSYKEE